jgi:N-acetylglucosamine-6-phosphate deacetylase
MTIQAIIGARILADGIWLDDHALVAKGGRIEAIVPSSAIPADADVAWLGGGMLVAGFIDTQVNGGGGVLFNDEPTVPGITAIAAAHRRFGTTALLPTLISDDLEVIAAAIAAVDEAVASDVPGIIGIHIEGPFLNAGKRGIHDSAKFRMLDEQTISLLSSLKNGKTLVTLAPELAPEGAIAALVEAGVIVAAGHTLATYEDIERGHAPVQRHESAGKSGTRRGRRCPRQRSCLRDHRRWPPCSSGVAARSLSGKARRWPDARHRCHADRGFE